MDSENKYEGGALSECVLYLANRYKDDSISFIESIALVKYLNPKTMNGVDVGCGSRKTIPSAVGLDTIRDNITDPSSGAVTKAELVGDGGNLIFKDETLDYVISKHTIEHIGEPLSICKEWLRVLKPGGYLCLVVPNAPNFDPPHGFEKTWFWDNVVRQISGVKVLEYDTLPHNYSFNCILQKIKCNKCPD